MTLVLLCLLTMLPGIFSLPPIDRDEARYVQASRQMLETGNYGDIRLQEVPRYKKPIGIYWLHAGAAQITGYGESAPLWVFRLVSLAGGIVAALATMWLATSMFGRTAGLAAGIAMASIVGLGIEARIAKTDAALLATVVLSQLFLARVYLNSGDGDRQRPIGSAPVLFWFFQGLGILIKGPIVVLVSGLTAITLLIFDPDRSWVRRLQIGRGVLIIVLINLPWLAYISWTSGAAFWQESVGRDLLGKLAEGQESHGFPPGYYFLTYSLFVWPLGYLALRAGLQMLNRFKVDASARFLIAWYVPFWLLFEVITTKLPHYMLPAYPALAISLGWHLTRNKDELADLKAWQKWLTWIALLGLAIVTAGLAAASVGIEIYFSGGVSPVGIAAALLIISTGLLTSPLGDKMRPMARLGTVAILVGGTYGLITSTILPRIDQIWISRQVAEIYHEFRPCERSVLTIGSYYEPSMVFLAGTETRLTDAEGAAQSIVEDAECAIVAVEDADAKSFSTAVENASIKLNAVGSAGGINYSNGQNLSFKVYVAR